MLKEILSDYLGHFHNTFLILRQRVLTNKLYNVIETFLLLQNVLNCIFQIIELRVNVVEISLKNIIVVSVWEWPVDWREVLSLSQLLIQSPEDLDYRHGGCCNRVSKVTSWRRNCTDNGNWSFSLWWSITGYLTCSLIKRG